jgi:cation:H+ antiporter
LLYVVAADHNISRFEGAGLFLAILAYTGFLIFQANKDRNVSKDFEDTDQDAPKQFYIGVNLALIVCGLVLLVLGSRWFVEGAVAIARYFEVSELVIGLTIVAIGTSLPEVATSIVAAIRGQRDIAVGNVVGSNIFNILSVLGLTALVVPGGVTVSAEALSFDIPVMIAVAIVCLPIFFSGSSISRFEGILFLSYYLFYIGYIVLNALKHQALPEFSYLIAYVAFPLTALALGISTFRSFRAKRLHVD